MSRMAKSQEIKNYIKSKQKKQNLFSYIQTIMIHDTPYNFKSQENQYHQSQLQYMNDQMLEQESEMIPEIKNTSKNSSKKLNFIKKLKSRDIKLRSFSHKKFQIYPHKPTSIINNISSLDNQNEEMQEQIQVQTRRPTNDQLKKIQKHRNYETTQNQREKQKITVEVISNFNPEHIMFSNQKYSATQNKNPQKKASNLELNNIQYRMRESRSQNKRQKINKANLQKTNIRGNAMNYENQKNIFKSLEMISKHNSHHSLDKNSNLNANANSHEISSKIQEKLHLPSLVGSSGLKPVKSKIYHNINSNHDVNEHQNDKNNIFLNEAGSLTQKSSPYLQKIVKIPIDRLKPLKPEQIKLKYQRKVKEEQKNRAKQRALQIFQKQEQEAQITRNMHTNDQYDLESDQNNPYENTDIQIDRKQPIESRNKTSLIKKQKFLANSKNDNIFKKHLLAYNANS